MNHPWDLFADFIGRTIAQRWAASRAISPFAPDGAKPSPNSANQKQEAKQGGKEVPPPGKTNSTSKEADVVP